MMYKIKKEFSFCAAHKLNNLAKDHPCSRLHGHNYVITVELSSEELNEPGFVLDYGKLDCLKKWIDKTLDHRYLNEVLPEINPSAENMARYFFIKFNMILKMNEFPPNLITAIEVSETPKTMSRYERS